MEGQNKKTPWRTTPYAEQELKAFFAIRIAILVLACALFAYFTYSTLSMSHEAFQHLCFIFASCGLLTLASWRWCRQSSKNSFFLHSQFILDSLIVSAIIYATGGPISPFLFLYLPVVMAASIFHSRTIALFMSLFCTVAYSIMVTALLHKWIPLADASDVVHLPMGGMVPQVLGLLCAMILVAIATSFLTRKLRFSTAEAQASRLKLQEFTEHQRQLIDELPDAVVTTDSHFAITSINQSASLFLGVDEVQVVNENIFDLLEDLDGTSSEIHKANARNEEFELSFEKNNQLQHVLCRVKTIYREMGEKVGHLFIFHDVTKLRSVEEQLEVHERMAKLLSLASREDETRTGVVQTKIAHFVGESPVMQQVFKLIARVAASNATVLVSGESGTGKELVARAIHLGSSRASMPFVPVNCGAIPENLIESELFGYKRGAFTGAAQDYQGLFKHADGGTIFLDEIGELPLMMQSKLLRAIQDKVIRHLGSDRSVPVDVRIIAATNKNLKKEVEEGRFREDLFYRLNVINIVLPPLRERREDIPQLTNSILKNLIGEGKTPVVPPATMSLLMNYSYPGNVRELENILERAYVLGGEVLVPEHLPEVVREAKSPCSLGVKPQETEIIVLENIEFPVNLDEVLGNIECRYLDAALKKTNGAKKKAAELLGINFRSFRYRISKFGLGVDVED
ncbi:MAG: sigma 54-interacting transcriptional regulator [SAR324 cluster bacterium]|uniref:Sigma 54-interacting transcriptional regulator n=1 Tax=SAR324 cluster bacterium TaxID=2024889 RepID=A0A7X9IJG0_9DELT|nr:sigma 54-interacting transcriptional regulator [SAR324 cluster bacterium]